MRDCLHWLVKPDRPLTSHKHACCMTAAPHFLTFLMFGFTAVLLMYCNFSDVCQITKKVRYILPSCRRCVSVGWSLFIFFMWLWHALHLSKVYAERATLTILEVHCVSAQPRCSLNIPLHFLIATGIWSCVCNLGASTCTLEWTSASALTTWCEVIGVWVLSGAYFITVL